MSSNSNYRSPSLFFQDTVPYYNSSSSIRPKFFNQDLYQKQKQDKLLEQQRLNNFLVGPRAGPALQRSAVPNLISSGSYANYNYFDSCTADVIPDQVSKIFFSEQNISTVQTAIKGLVKLKTSYVIQDQSEAFLITIMLDVFQKCNKSLQYDFLQQVRNLNDIVITQCVQNAILAIQAQDNYFKSLNKIYFLDSNPLATSIKGQNVLEIKKP